MSSFHSFLKVALAISALAPTSRSGCTGVVPIGQDCTVIPCASNATWDPSQCACVPKACAPVPCPSDATWDPVTCTCDVPGTGGGHP